ncbi:MAG: YifB family Mg chelatase-like AAA ATPase [Lachnospiraceae bacterium]|nr:YifB family Mg chelatase-like AAA ATPase [Lachnospiraceae bacterium]
MYRAVISGAFRGLDSFLVQVEVDISEGLPCMDMIGYLANEVKESKERVRVGIKNSGFSLPIKRITVSLTPADVRKDGSGFDLPVAVGVLSAIESGGKDRVDSGGECEAELTMPGDMVKNIASKTGIEAESGAETKNDTEAEREAAGRKTDLSAATDEEKERFAKETLVIGELGLDGEVKPVKGILPILLSAEKNGIRNCILPAANRKEAENVKGIRLFPVMNLRQAYEIYASCGKQGQDMSEEKPKTVGLVDFEIADKEGEKCNPAKVRERTGGTTVDKKQAAGRTNPEPDFAQICGQEQAKRAAAIAAAGFHNLLLFGPPGSGKSMIAERIPTILPEMTYEECLEVTQIYSVAGLLGEGMGLVTRRPYERPHHTITPVALTGGGAYPLPGAITLAHKGVLFLDELPEFGREKLDLLRQPLEEKKIRIIRSQYACDYDCDFMFVAAMNPCPCGFYPDRKRCNCKEQEIDRYLKRISGPILDRMDISVEVGKISWQQLRDETTTQTSAQIRAKVTAAHERQMQRQGKYNAALTNSELDNYVNLTGEAGKLLARIFDKKQLSIRGYQRIRKLARTIADYEGSKKVETAHLSEAVMLNQGMESLKKRGDEV